MFNNLEEYIQTVTERFNKPRRNLVNEGILKQDLVAALIDVATFVQITNSAEFIQASIELAETISTQAGEYALEANETRLATIQVLNQAVQVLSETGQLKNATEMIREQILTISTQQSIYKGIWDASTNTPTLSTNVPANGSWYEIGKTGTQNITGSAELYLEGQKIISNGAIWELSKSGLVPGSKTVSHDKFSDDMQKSVGVQEDQAFVNGKEVLDVTRDRNGDVIEAYFADGTKLTDISISLGIKNGINLSKNGTAYTLNHGTTEGQAPFGSGFIESEEYGFVNGKEVLDVTRDKNGDIIEAVFVDGTLYSAQELLAARGLKTSLKNRLSGIISERGLPTTPIWGAEKLRRWNAWKRNPDYRFDYVFIADSFFQGDVFNVLPSLRNFLISEGYSIGGAGFCGFNRSSVNSQDAINGSINRALFGVSYNLDHWARSGTAGYNPGLEGTISSNVANATITLTSNQAGNTVTILFEKHVGGGDFRYRTNANAWSTVSTAHSEADVDTVVIDVSGLGSSFTITIEALSIGVILCGAIARNNLANSLTMHKSAISGGTAGSFGQNAMWSKSLSYLTPKAAIIMFCTNDKGANVPPLTYKGNIQNLITRLRLIDPLCDIILAMPTFTKDETETPTTYSLKDYASVLFELSQENHTAFVDNSQIFGSFSQSLIDNGFMNIDRIHPGTKGGTLIAENFFKLLQK